MAYSPQIEFYKKRQFSDKINATFTFLRENAWPYIKIQLMIAGPILLLTNILTNQLSIGFLGFSPEDVTASMILDFFKLYGLILLSTLVTATLVPIITFSYMKAYQNHAPNEISAAMVLKNLGSKFFNLLGFNILMYIAIIIAMFFLVLPAIYIGIVLSLGSAIILFEENNPIDTFSRAFTLIKGKWWSTFGLVIVMGIIGYVISLFFGLPRTLLFSVKAITTTFSDGDLSAVTQMTTGEQALSILFSVFETFGSILLYSLSYIAIAFQYFNLVERRESRGLMSQIEGMDKAAADDDEHY
ncbi:hypothetical protein [Roseivirga thermotolerans]|uniref:DUF7847 domain-containing protein n=1 Tax=Roseivirga thermotolerans TaxID=1758176 RepID=A0ABQ3I4X4_9BACT|nr:hypothetical protein [Roseivirga thermotolerans]GHE58050.1 hypothetical protein GCM10011340_11550 [Roseivirga thermotolerans]